MSKLDPEAKKKLVAGKKAAKDANKKKAKIQQRAAADKIILGIAEALPGAGQAKEFLQCDHELDELEAKAAVIALAKRGVRGRLKEMKIYLQPYDMARKLKKMDPEDRQSYKASQAIYEQTMGLELSPQQKETIEAMNKKRVEAANALAESSAGGIGKEIGSSTAPAQEGATLAPKAEALPSLPQRNDALLTGIRPGAAAGSTH